MATHTWTWYVREACQSWDSLVTINAFMISVNSVYCIHFVFLGNTQVHLFFELLLRKKVLYYRDSLGNQMFYRIISLSLKRL